MKDSWNQPGSKGQAILVVSALVISLISTLFIIPSHSEDNSLALEVAAHTSVATHAPIAITGNGGFLNPNATTGILWESSPQFPPEIVRTTYKFFEYGPYPSPLGNGER